MTNRTYTSITDIERARALCEKGVFLTERTVGYHRLMLYQLHDVYIEVCWHTHFNVAMRVKTFTDTELLEPYLEKISLEDLFDR